MYKLDLHVYLSYRTLSLLCNISYVTVNILYTCFLSFSLHNLTTPYQGNRTPLFTASHCGHYDVVQTLLGAGADVDVITTVSDMCD